MSEYRTDYYLSHPVFGKKQVTKEEFIAAERQAGFFPKSGNPEDCATGGFSSNGVSGHVEYIKLEKEIDS